MMRSRASPGYPLRRAASRSSHLRWVSGLQLLQGTVSALAAVSGASRQPRWQSRCWQRHPGFRQCAS
jgi:hypothetical protein